MQRHRPGTFPHALTIPTIIRFASRLAPIVVTAAIALFPLLLAVAVISRYAPDAGYCPDAPLAELAELAELAASILAFAAARGMRPDEIGFVGMPRYHADRFGWWSFDLKSGEARYVATIDYGRRVTGFGKFQMLPPEPAEPMPRGHSFAGIEPRAADPVAGYR